MFWLHGNRVRGNSSSIRLAFSPTCSLACKSSRRSHLTHSSMRTISCRNDVSWNDAVVVPTVRKMTAGYASPWVLDVSSCYLADRCPLLLRKPRASLPQALLESLVFDRAGCRSCDPSWRAIGASSLWVGIMTSFPPVELLGSWVLVTLR